LGAQISNDYEGKSLLLVGVLRGVIFFISDLMRAIRIPLEVDFMSVTNYSPDSRNMGFVRLVKDLEISITDRHVLFVEDIIDTGLTLNYLLRTLKTRKPASLEVCALFNKEKRRLIDLPLRYKGFDIPDYYIVGYGLDYREKYRNMPFVGLLKADVLHNG
jgi:hypoxanthine phosphoribosyltransferase